MDYFCSGLLTSFTILMRVVIMTVIIRVDCNLYSQCDRVLTHLSLVVGAAATPILLFNHSVLSSRLQHTRLPCPSPSPRVHSNSCPLSWLCHPPFLLPSISPRIRIFLMSRLFTSGGQDIGASASASASVLPMNIQC